MTTFIMSFIKSRSAICRHLDHAGSGGASFDRDGAGEAELYWRWRVRKCRWKRVAVHDQRKLAFMLKGARHDQDHL